MKQFIIILNLPMESTLLYFIWQLASMVWMRIDRPGIYRGQCSEICGTGHGYMPVVIEAVSEDEFAAWVNEAKNEFAELNNRTIALSK